MSSYVLSNAADTDLINIFEESVVRWGIDRASRYLMELHGAFELISKFPNLGIDAGRLRPGYFRFTRESPPSIFKKPTTAFLSFGCCTKSRARKTSSGNLIT
jgi:plasmid stabilization system protein ParE